MIGICMPTFLLGPLLVLVFGIHLEWLPVSGWGDMPGDKTPSQPDPGRSLCRLYCPPQSRAGMLEVMSQDYIRTARAKGLPEWQVVIAPRPARRPDARWWPSSVPAFAGLLAGSFVVETIFQIPGLGRFYVQAAFNRDYTMILGTTVFLSTLIVLFNLLSDIHRSLAQSAPARPVSREALSEYRRGGQMIALVAEQGTSLWQDAWRRLRKNRLALFGLVCAQRSLSLIALLTPWLAPYAHDAQNLDLGAYAAFPRLTGWAPISSAATC